MNKYELCTPVSTKNCVVSWIKGNISRSARSDKRWCVKCTMCVCVCVWMQKSYASWSKCGWQPRCITSGFWHEILPLPRARIFPCSVIQPGAIHPSLVTSIPSLTRNYQCPLLVWDGRAIHILGIVTHQGIPHTSQLTTQTEAFCYKLTPLNPAKHKNHNNNIYTPLGRRFENHQRHTFHTQSSRTHTRIHHKQETDRSWDGHWTLDTGHWTLDTDSGSVADRLRCWRLCSRCITVTLILSVSVSVSVSVCLLVCLPAYVCMCRSFLLVLLLRKNWWMNTLW
jgi:hypothetical protein